MKFIKRLFGSAKSNQPTRMTFDEATDIAGDYGEILELAKGVICDTNKLPKHKDVIKNALVVMLNNIENPYMREQLKIAYISLADFQDGVGEEDIGYKIPDGPLTPNNARERLESASSKMARVVQWMKIAASEREQLIAELKDLGLWR